MLNPQKTAEREALLKRLRAAYAELAQHQRNLVEGEARLPLEEQLRLKLLRLMDSNLPELTADLELRRYTLDGGLDATAVVITASQAVNDCHVRK